MLLEHSDCHNQGWCILHTDWRVYGRVWVSVCVSVYCVSIVSVCSNVIMVWLCICIAVFTSCCVLSGSWSRVYPNGWRTPGSSGATRIHSGKNIYHNIHDFYSWVHIFVDYRLIDYLFLPSFLCVCLFLSLPLSLTLSLSFSLTPAPHPSLPTSLRREGLVRPRERSLWCCPVVSLYWSDVT